MLILIQKYNISESQVNLVSAGLTTADLTDGNINAVSMNFY